MPPDAAVALGVFGNGPSEIPNGLRELSEQNQALVVDGGTRETVLPPPSQVIQQAAESVSAAVVESVTPEPTAYDSGSSGDSGGGGDSGGSSAGE